MKKTLGNAKQTASQVELLIGSYNSDLVVPGLASKVPTSRLIAGINLVDNITVAELTAVLNEATTTLKGLMSPTDKSRLNTLYALLNDNTDGSADTVVDNIEEVLAIFNNYPEGADLVTALAGKVDKVTGKGLSTNDYTTTEKSKLSGIQAGAQVNVVTSVAGKTGAVTLNQDNISDSTTYKRVTQTEKDTWNAKQTAAQVEALIGSYDSDLVVPGLASKLSASAKGETANKTLSYGGTFKVLQTLANGTVNERTITMPNEVKPVYTHIFTKDTLGNHTVPNHTKYSMYLVHISIVMENAIIQSYQSGFIPNNGKGFSAQSFDPGNGANVYINARVLAGNFTIDDTGQMPWSVVSGTKSFNVELWGLSLNDDKKMKKECYIGRRIQSLPGLNKNDYIVNKVFLGEWNNDDPRFIAYKNQRAIKRSRMDEIDSLIG